MLPRRKPKYLEEALQEMKAQVETETATQQTLNFEDDNNDSEEKGGKA